MNDHELDRLLDSWETPEPPMSVREDLRARFPRPEPRKFARPLRWVLLVAATAAASVILAIAMEQSAQNPWDLPVARVLNQLYEHFRVGVEIWQVTHIRTQIRQSEPKVYVDGKLVSPLEYGGGASMRVQVPGDGVYLISLYPPRAYQADGRPTGWAQAGHIHGNLIEFQAGDKQVRIECTKVIVDSDSPVFVLRQP